MQNSVLLQSSKAQILKMKEAGKPKDAKRVLGVFTLTMINVAAIQSLRNLPVMASVGWESLIFYLTAAATFFIPTALIAAELATGWPSSGGIYTWVKEAFGPRWGFVAIWLQWVENVIWYPTVLSFTAATIAYLFNPEHANNQLYITFMVLSTYWLCTWIDLRGMQTAGWMSSVGVILGTLLPAAAIIALGGFWILSGRPSGIPFSPERLLPDLSHLSNIVFLAGVMLGFAGMEMSAVHAREVERPQVIYPKAIFFSTFIILIVSILGSLSIACVVPREEISLVAGVMQAFAAFFRVYGIEWMTPVLAGLISLGAISMVSTWIIGPSKGLYQTAHEGHLPPIFHKKNRHGMPIAIMLMQGIVVSLLSLAFLYMPTVSSSYWILNALTALLYIAMYAFMFAAAIRLRYSRPHVQRHYRIPGGKNLGMWIIGGLGLASSLFGFCIGFLPPAQLEIKEQVQFTLFLALGIVLMFALPLLIFSLKKDHWKIDISKEH